VSDALRADDAVLVAIVRSAVAATGAATGWLAVPDEPQLRIVTASGAQAASVLGHRLAATGAASFALGSAQPAALAPRGADPGFEPDLAAVLGHTPSAVLCVPCEHDDRVVAVLELVDKQGGGPFTFDDVEVAVLLGGIAGPAVRDGGTAEPPVASPAELGRELGVLAELDPARFAFVAKVLRALTDS
jgi:sigma-B regulation protein RsbU (phosphoserine phosphatase)